MKSLIVLASAAFTSLVAAQCDAQLVRVGPLGGVSIRAPFVSVDTLPFGGGTRVRAPLTSINTGLYGGGFVRPPVYYRPPIYRSYSAIVPVYPVAPAVDIYERTNFYGTLGVYTENRVHLGTASPVYPPIGSPSLTRDPLYDTLDAQRSAMYRAARPSYDVGGLDSMVAPRISAIGRTSLRLRQSASQLTRSINLLGDQGSVWMDYLQPQRIIDVLDGLDEETGPEELQVLLANYDGTAGNAELPHIWSIPGFRETNQGLREWLDATRGVVEANPSGTPVPMTRPRPPGNFQPPSAPNDISAPSQFLPPPASESGLSGSL